MAALRSDSTPRRVLVKVAGDNPMLDRPGRNLGARPEAQLVSKSRDVALAGALGDKQAVGDLSVGHAAGDHGDDLEFPAAQRARVQRWFRLHLALAKCVLQHAVGAHRQTVVPGAFALATTKLLPGQPARVLELPDPEGARAQRPLAGHVINNGGKG